MIVGDQVNRDRKGQQRGSGHRWAAVTLFVTARGEVVCCPLYYTWMPVYKFTVMPSSVNFWRLSDVLSRPREFAMRFCELSITMYSHVSNYFLYKSTHQEPMWNYASEILYPSSIRRVLGVYTKVMTDIKWLHVLLYMWRISYAYSQHTSRERTREMQIKKQ